MPAAVAIGGGAVVGGLGSFFGGKSQADASRDAASYALQGTRESIAAQREQAKRAFEVYQSEAAKSRKYLTQQAAIARRDLAPLRKIGLQNLQIAQDYTDPNSALAQQERDAFGETLARNLSARGLTASGTEIAGLSDFETSLARERRNLALNLAGVGAGSLNSLSQLESNLGQNLAGISSGVGSTGAQLFGNLGANIGNALSQGGLYQGQSLIAQAQANAQGLAGLSNAFQTGAYGLASLYQNRAAQAQQNAQFNQLFGALRSGGSIGPQISKNGYGDYNPSLATIG